MSKLLKSKFLVGIMLVAVLVVGGLAVATQHASAQQAIVTVADVQYASTVKLGSSGQAALIWQRFLNGYSTTAQLVEDGKFGPLSVSQAKAWQASKGLVADGVMGAMSRASAIAQIAAGAPASAFAAGCSSYSGYSTSTGLSCAQAVPVSYPVGCSSAVGYSTSTGLACSVVVTYPAGCTALSAYSSTTGLSCTGTTPVVTGLTGGAGTVDTYTLISSLSNEEVGEGISNVKVYGMDIEVGDGSDISLNAIKLVFNEGTAASNFKDYADDVTIWLGSTKIATIDSDKFTDDNSWTYTASLTGAKIPAGTTGKLYVAVSGVSNLDTNDATDTWTLDVTSIRWVDAQGSLISEDPTLAVRTFSFETSAVAADTEFKISSDLASVNDAHVIDIEATESTPNVSILSFKVKIEGTSDVTLKDLPVNVTVATQDNVDEMVEGLSLWMDGAEVSNVNMTTDGVEDADGVAVGNTETYVFYDVDTVLKAGQTYHFLVKADIYGITDTGDVAAGDSILAVFGETQTDLTDFDAEDETGTNLLDADKTGTVTGSASVVRDTGINVAYVSSTAVISHAGDINNTTDSDQGTFTVTFDVTAFGADMFLDGTKPTEAAADAVMARVSVSNTDTYLDSNIRSSTGATQTGTLDTTSTYTILEGETERFTVTYVTTAGADGLFQVSLLSLAYSSVSAATSGDTMYNYNMADYKTPSLNMQNDAS